MIEEVFDLNEEQEESGTFIVIQLNDKIMPIDRGIQYEDPLFDFLEEKQYGEVTGGGTMQLKSGEIQYCDIEVLIYEGNDVQRITDEIIHKLEELGAPKGSHLTIDDSEEPIHFGSKEGLAIYLDGVNLPDHVYAECDSNVVLDELSKRVGYDGEVQRYWQGNTETAFYFYGESYEAMKNAISDFTSTYPLCENARIVQIA